MIKLFEEYILNESKFEVGDECYLLVKPSERYKVGGKDIMKVKITKIGRSDDDKRGYSWEEIRPNTHVVGWIGWSKDENKFVKEIPPQPERKYTPEDPYGEEEW